MFENIIQKFKKAKDWAIYNLKYIFYFKFVLDIPKFLHLILDVIDYLFKNFIMYSLIGFKYAFEKFRIGYSKLIFLIFDNILIITRKTSFYYRVISTDCIVKIEHYFVKTIDYITNQYIDIYKYIVDVLQDYKEDRRFKLRVFSIILFGISIFLGINLQYNFNKNNNKEFVSKRIESNVFEYKNFDEISISQSYKTTETFKNISELKSYFSSRGFNSKHSKHIISLIANQLRINKSKSNIIVEMEITGGYTEYVKPFIVNLEVKFDNENSMILSWDLHENKYTYALVEKPLILHERFITGQNISGYSLHNNLIQSGVPKNLVSKFIKIFNYDIDFQRDLSQDYKYSIVFYDYKSLDGELVKSDDIVYAKFINHKRKFEYYRYYKNNKFEYYNAKGISRVKSLMKTPVAAGNLTSRFGLRKHPVLGFTKLHKGIDFASKPGTKVYAAGDGVVEIAKRSGSFGIYIKIRHPNKLHTLYAHLKGIAKGITVGKRLKQGDTIGYVGSTGRSTGPHLHYEVHKSKVAVDPLKLNLKNRGSKLSKTQLREFRKIVRRFDGLE